MKKSVQGRIISKLLFSYISNFMVFFFSLGRKRTTQIPMFLGGVFCALAAIIDKDTTSKSKEEKNFLFPLSTKIFTKVIQCVPEKIVLGY